MRPGSRRWSTQASATGRPARPCRRAGRLSHAGTATPTPTLPCSSRSSFPISLTITGNIAVVQYRYQIAREDYKKERETVWGRYTDVLVKEGGRWLFIAWTGGDDPKK